MTDRTSQSVDDSSMADAWKLYRVDNQRLILRVGMPDSTDASQTIPVGSIEPGGVYLRPQGDGLPVRFVEETSAGCRLTPVSGPDSFRKALHSATTWTSLIAEGDPPEDRIVDDGVADRIRLESGDVLCAAGEPALFQVVAGYVRLNTGQREVMPQYMLLDQDLWCRAEAHAELRRIPLDGDEAPFALQHAIVDLGSALQAATSRLLGEASGKAARQIAAARESEQTGIGNALRMMSGILVGRRLDLVPDVPGEPDRFTAIRIVAQAGGIDLPDLSDLWNHTDTFEDTVRAVSDRTGFAIRSVALGDRWHSLDAGPILTRRRDDHAPVAIVPHGSGRYRATAMSFGKQTSLGRISAAAERTFDDEGWMFYRPLPLRPMGLRDVASQALRGTWVDLGLMLLIALLTALVSLAIPIGTGLLVGKVIPSGADQGVLGVVLALVVAALATAILGVAGGIVRIRFETRASMHVMAGAVLRTMLLPAKFFDRFTAGDLTQRLMTIEHLRQTISGAVVTALLHTITVVVYLGLIFYYSWQMAVVAFGLVIVVLIYMSIFSLAQVKFVRIVQESTGELEGMTNQMIEGVRVIRANRAESRVYSRWVDVFARQRLAAYRDQTISNVLQVFHVVLSLVATGVCVFLIGRGWVGIDSAGQYMAFSAAFGALMGSMFGFSVVLVPLVRLVPIYDRLKPIFLETPENAVGTPPGRLQGRIVCRNLRFAYDAGGRNIIDGLDLTVEPGEFVAIVGDSGCGKSTLIKLLLGFERPTSGEISFDNRALHSLDLRSVRMQVGTAIQDGSLLPGDIRTNILGASSLPIEEAWKVAQTVGLAPRIRSMPMGMFTFVTDQIVSPAFRQQMLLAKALVGNPSMLIVDEVTSQLDVMVQREIQERIDALGITRIMVAHRLSTIRNADRIHVLDRGRIVQSGDYETLAAEDGPFRDKIRKGDL